MNASLSKADQLPARPHTEIRSATKKKRASIASGWWILPGLAISVLLWWGTLSLIF